MSSCNNLLSLQSGFKLQGLMKTQWYTIQPGKLCLCWVTYSWLCWRAELFAANAFTTRRCEKCRKSCSKQVNKWREICVELRTQSQRKVSTLQFIYITLISNDADSILHTYEIAQYSALKYPIIITYMLQAVSWKILPDKIVETKTIKPKLDDATVLWRIVQNRCVRSLQFCWEYLCEKNRPQKWKGFTEIESKCIFQDPDNDEESLQKTIQTHCSAL